MSPDSGLLNIEREGRDLTKVREQKTERKRASGEDRTFFFSFFFQDFAKIEKTKIKKKPVYYTIKLYGCL